MTANAPDWPLLFRTACALIDQANALLPTIDHWTFGGGTALMLQIDHRDSRDVDIFLADPQLLGCLDPGKHSFKFEVKPSGYEGDGTQFLKLAFEDIGEIDFIVAKAITDTPTTTRTIEGVATQLETVAEIIAKKVHYRGANITPRDIFDIAAAGKDHKDEVVETLRRRKDEVAQALVAMGKLNPEFVRDTIAALAVRESYRCLTETALLRAKAILESV